MTRVLKETLAVVKKKANSDGVIPPIAEVARALGVKYSTAQRRLERMVTSGMLHKVRNGEFQIPDSRMLGQNQIVMDASEIKLFEAASSNGSVLAEGALQMARTGQISIVGSDRYTQWIEEAMKFLELARVELPSLIAQHAIESLLDRSPIQGEKRK